MSANWKASLTIYLAFACIATMLLSSLSSNLAVPGVYDFLNHIDYIIQAKQALKEGQIFLRTAPTELAAYRYPIFQFYSPTSFTFSGLIYAGLTPSNPYIAFKTMLWLALFIGGIYMYRLAFWFVKSKPAAFLSSVAYLTAPYYLVVINHMGAFNEALALGCIPIVLYYTLKRYHYPFNTLTLLKTAIAWYLLITIHLITFFYTSITIALLLIFATIKNPRYWKNLIDVSIAYALACLLAMWYLAPTLIYGKQTFMSKTLNFMDLHRPALSDLLSPTLHITFLLKDSVSSLHPNLGLPILLAVSVCLYAFLHEKNLSTKKLNFWLTPLLATFAIAFLMVWSPINFWQWLPNAFSVAQYSWRLLSQVIWIGALLFAWGICFVFKEQLDIRHVIVGLILIVGSTVAWMPVLERSTFELKDFLKAPHAILNPRGYLIDTAENLSMVSYIDHSSLNSLLQDNTNLILNEKLLLEPALVNLANAPVLNIQSDISDQTVQRFANLKITINNKLIFTYALKKGRLNWTIPLAQVKQALAQYPKPTIKFQLLPAPSDITATSLPIKKIEMQGFLKSTDVISVAQMHSHCMPHKTITTCKLFVPASVWLLELPVFYYPELLNITLNGKKTSYVSVLNGSAMMAGIYPQAGKENIITIQFRGLVWANYVSYATWLLCVLLLLFLSIKKFGVNK